MTAPARVLVVDDEALIAMVLEDMLADLGCDVVGPAASIAEALSLIVAGTIDAALVDINLRGVPSDPVAHRLHELAIPFAFVTGMADRRQDAFADVPVLQKPFSAGEIERVVGGLLGASRPPAESDA